MLQRNEDKMAPGLEFRNTRIPHRESRDALLEVKDRIIAELRERVALLHGELKRKDAILSRIAEDIGELMPAPRVSDAADAPRTVAPARVQECNDQARKVQERREKPALPDGYRVVAVASDAWVLVAPRGLRVAGYRGELDLWKAALDAREHHQRGQ